MFSFRSHYEVNVYVAVHRIVDTDAMANILNRQKHSCNAMAAVDARHNLELGGNSAKSHYWASSKCIAKFVIPGLSGAKHILICCKCQHHE